MDINKSLEQIKVAAYQDELSKIAKDEGKHLGVGAAIGGAAGALASLITRKPNFKHAATTAVGGAALGSMLGLATVPGKTSEVFNTVTGMPVSFVPAVMGYTAGPRKNVQEIKDAEKRGVSNFLLPFAAPYRLGRRMATEHMSPGLYNRAMKEIKSESKDN